MKLPRPILRPRRPSARSSLLLACAALLAPMGLGAGPTACLVGTCDLAACSAGFDLTIDGGEGMDERLAAGTYRVRAEADDGLFELECTFDDEGRATCGDGQWLVSPSTNLDVGADVWPADEYDASRGDAIHLGFVASSSARHGRNEFGPDSVDITVERDGMELVSTSFVPDYDVHEDFNGEGCGDCEHASDRLHVPSS